MHNSLENGCWLELISKYHADGTPTIQSRDLTMARRSILCHTADGASANLPAVFWRETLLTLTRPRVVWRNYLLTASAPKYSGFVQLWTGGTAWRRGWSGLRALASDLQRRLLRRRTVCACALDASGRMTIILGKSLISFAKLRPPIARPSPT